MAAAIDRRHVRADRVSRRIQSVVTAAPQTSVIVLNYTQTAKVLGSFVIKGDILHLIPSLSGLVVVTFNILYE